MGITIVFIAILVLILMLIIRSKLPITQKIAVSIGTILLLFFLLAYLFISGFESGRTPKKTAEELNQEEKK